MRKIIIVAAFVVLIITASGAARAQDAKPGAAAASADQVLADFRKAAADVKSFSSHIERVDLGDEFVVVRHEAAMKAYEPILSKLELLTRKKMLPEFKPEYRNVAEYNFIKPFSIQVTMTINDFLPPLMNGSIVYFRPDVNKEEIFLKEPLLGIVFRRPADFESAAVMVSNWTFDLIEIDCALTNGGGVTYAGTEEHSGRKMNIIEVSLKKGAVPWKMGCGGYGYGVPKTAYPQLNVEMKMMEDRLTKYGQEAAFIRLWIDPALNLSVRKTIRFGDKLAVEMFHENIELNKVEVKKLIKPKKAK